MADFKPAYDQLIDIEGGYKLINVPDDPGGLTYAGISRRSHPDWLGWVYLDRGQTPNSLVLTFYRDQYWNRFRLGEVRNQDVAECILLSVVNAEAVINECLQPLLGLKADGAIGPKTLAAINAADPKWLITAFSLAKVDRYRQIVNKKRSQGKFLLGWLNRVFLEARIDSKEQ